MVLQFFIKGSVAHHCQAESQREARSSSSQFSAMARAQNPSAVAMQPRRRRTSPAVAALLLLAACGALAMVFGSTVGFVGIAALPGAVRGDRVAMASKATRTASRNRRRNNLQTRKRKILVDGEEMLIDYKENLGPEATDVAFDASAATGKTVTAEFQARPFGILRYKAGKDGKGAMVMSVGRPFFVGDTSGQAMDAGVEPGMVVNSIGGKDMSKAPFDEIVTLLGDEALANYQWVGDKRRALEPPEKKPETMPLSVTFAQIPGFQMAS